jgi:hypothetical protein
MATAPIYIVRKGVLLAVPVDYHEAEAHRALVTRLSSTNSYRAAVTALESAPPGHWLAADILTGAPWARRYLNTTAKLWLEDKKLAGRGVRALMRALSGSDVKAGRRREAPLSPEDTYLATSALACWRVLLDEYWTGAAGDRVWLAGKVTRSAEARFRVSAAHRRALRALLRRRRLRKADLVLTLASWETGIPQRRLRSIQPVAELVYA